MTNKLNMLYDKLEKSKITLGKTKEFNGGKITPIYYDGGSLDFSLKNKYVKVKGIETNTFNKKFISIKSKEFSDLVDLVSEQVNVPSPVFGNGNLRINVKENSKIKGNTNSEEFDACVAINIPTIFETSEGKLTIQLNVKELVIIKNYNDELEIDLDKLKLAI